MKDGSNPNPLKYPHKIQSPNYPLGQSVKLPNPEVKPNTSFLDVLETRKTQRHFSKINLQQVSDLLWYACRVKTVVISKEENILTHRPYPSAGAIHPVDIFISLPHELSNRTLHYYDPFNHAIINLEVDQKKLINFFQHVNNNLSLANAALLWLIVDLPRTSSSYKNPHSLVWRDAGAALFALQLVAEALRLNSCQIGSLAQPYISRLFSNKMKLISGGGIAIGN